MESGVTWAELNHELQVFGLAATGAMWGRRVWRGLTLGGGLGWMVRKHGCALDNLLSADVVLADGQFLSASETANSDLFWGIRGGGGNFGVVTSFQFRSPLRRNGAGRARVHPLSKAGEAMRFWRDFETTAPEEASNGAVMFTAPPGLPLPEPLRGEPIVGIGGVWVGPLDVGERALRPLREFGPPAADTYERMPYSTAQTMGDFLWTRGSYNYWKSNFMKSLSDQAIDTILGFVATVPSPRTVVVLEHDGDSAWSRVSGRCHRIRSSKLALQHRGYLCVDGCRRIRR